MWLNERNLDIRCVRLQPYKLGDQVLLDIEQIIPLPEAEDYQVKVREQLEERRAAAKTIKDTTKYLFMGNVYNKRKLVLAVITRHIKEHPELTFESLRQDFPARLHSHFSVVILQDKAQEIFINTGHKRYFIAENEILDTCDGKKIAVCTQWSIGNINNFIEQAQNLGYQIETQ